MASIHQQSAFATEAMEAMDSAGFPHQSSGFSYSPDSAHIG